MALTPQPMPSSDAPKSADNPESIAQAPKQQYIDVALRSKPSGSHEVPDNNVSATVRQDDPVPMQLVQDNGKAIEAELGGATQLFGPDKELQSNEHGQVPRAGSESTPAEVADSGNPEKQALTEQEGLEKTNFISKSISGDIHPPPPPPKDDHYLDPTPRTPMTSMPVSRAHSNSGLSEDEDQNRIYSDSLEKSKYNQGIQPGQNSEHDAGIDNGSSAEIQSIMEQFDEQTEPIERLAIDSPRLEVANQYHMQHPPRRSSLEPVRPPSVTEEGTSIAKASPTLNTDIPPAVPLKSPPVGSNRSASVTVMSPSFETPSSPPSLLELQKPPPPIPDPEPDLPFDFHRFLEQLRHKSADPVAGYLRSFLNEFNRKQWMVHEQCKIISDFLVFITAKMEQCEAWKGVSDAEFDNAREGMEKLIMNRLYSQTFSPAIPAQQANAASKGKRKQTDGPPLGRRGQHQEDVERDDVLAQKVQIYGWVQDKHLDIPPISNNSKKFLILAQQELLKIKGYRAPRDKIICVLNSCKVIMGLLSKTGSDSSADSFIPLLILVVLQANPEHLVSNVQYILRFRSQEKLGGEAGYYLSSLMGAVQFIETLDRTNLTVSDSDFEKNVEESVSAIAEKHGPTEEALNPPRPLSGLTHISEKSTISNPQVTPRNSSEAERAPRRRTSLSKAHGSDRTGSPDSGSDDAVAGLLRTIQKPLSSIGRIFADDSEASSPSQRRQRGAQDPRRVSSEGRQSGDRRRESTNPSASHEQKLNAQEAAARQASAEALQAEKIQRAEHSNVVETLAGMFPLLDKEVIDDVVRMKEGRVGLAVDACLALSSTG
ncbi:MAG: hypothetical protein M1814_003641 [Vezdaea aestivalis]|nr:MAG: hypothetical protein M1814_003641 [Vezdaea aestivalis]